MDTTQLLPPDFLQAEEEDASLDLTAHLEHACRILDVENWILQRLKHPEREITVNLPLIRDDGEAVIVAGYRAQHSRARGPSLGPVILSPDAHLAQLRTTASEMTLQTALLDVLLGGAAGALVIEPERLSERELRRILTEYAAAMRDNIGPEADVLAPDGNEITVAWMMAGASLDSRTHPAGFVGKPAALGGIPGLAHVIAGGVLALVEYVAQMEKTDLPVLRVAMQGFGTTGQAIVHRLHTTGAQVVAIADRSGGVSRAGGIDVAALCRHLAHDGVVFGFPGAEAVQNADVLESECDVLFLGAAPGQVTVHNADRVQSRIVVEMVPGAVSATAERMLTGRGATIVPSLLGSAARTAAWASEWEHGMRFAIPVAEEVETVVRCRVLRALQAALACSDKYRAGLRVGAELAAVGRIAAALRLR